MQSTRKADRPTIRRRKDRAREPHLTANEIASSHRGSSAKCALQCPNPSPRDTVIEAFLKLNEDYVECEICGTCLFLAVVFCPCGEKPNDLTPSHKQHETEAIQQDAENLQKLVTLVIRTRNLRGALHGKLPLCRTDTQRRRRDERQSRVFPRSHAHSSPSAWHSTPHPRSLPLCVKLYTFLGIALCQFVLETLVRGHFFIEESCQLWKVQFWAKCQTDPSPLRNRIHSSWSLLSSQLCALSSWNATVVVYLVVTWENCHGVPAV